jgi:YidC/Oxa1 family membrane protein insertase
MNIFTTILIQPLANGLVIFYKLLGGNMGLAIIGFSVFLRVVLNPLTKPYMESMKKMRDLGPQLEKLKKKHGKDKVKFAQAQADFYKEKGVNPGAGCLPYILQIVVLIAFFNMFIKVLSPNGDATLQFNQFLYEPLKFLDGEVLNIKFLYLDITKPDCFGPGKCPTNPFSLLFPIPGPILILSALIQFLSAKIGMPYTRIEEKVAKKTAEKSDDFQVSMQKSMIYTFPLFTLFIGMQFAAGLAIYWFVFSATQAYQQVKTQGWGQLTPWIEKLKL